MNTFVLGTVVGLETVNYSSGSAIKFGLLSGRTCKEFTVYSTQKDFQGNSVQNPLYAKANRLKDGMYVCAIVRVVARADDVNYYIDNLGIADPSLKDKLNECFNK